MLESVSLQKNRLWSAKNVIFSLLCILVERPMGGGGFEPPKPPPCVRPCKRSKREIGNPYILFHLHGILRGNLILQDYLHRNSGKGGETVCRDFLSLIYCELGDIWNYDKHQFYTVIIYWNSVKPQYVRRTYNFCIYEKNFWIWISDSCCLQNYLWKANLNSQDDRRICICEQSVNKIFFYCVKSVQLPVRFQFRLSFRGKKIVISKIYKIWTLSGLEILIFMKGKFYESQFNKIVQYSTAGLPIQSIH